MLRTLAAVLLSISLAVAAIPNFAHANPADLSADALAASSAGPPYSCAKLGFPTSPPKKSVLCQRAC